MSIKQISVFLENRPGTLRKLTGVLAENKIDLRALSLAETKDFGIARIVVDDIFTAMNVLKEADFVASLTPVLAVEVPDEPGGLDKLLNIFSEAEVNIEYMYAFLGGKDAKHAYMILRVSDSEAGEVKLAGPGLRLLRQEDIEQI
ncbi:MAG: ACT domain-containing protein [Lachnospiraceae bacterium]|nr:ACT domain-containing protein [Lachnospiraceae bacterium]